MQVTLTVGLPNFGSWGGGDWRALLDVARAADDAGVDRVVVTDHVVMGRSLDAYVWGRFPTPPDGPWLEPLTVLAAIAGATRRVRLATGILIAPLRPATVLAKTVATLDVLSGGRVDLGVGVGWQEAEYVATGVDFATRGRRLDDTIAACRALWEQRPASYSSPSASFADVYCAPAPAQPRLPVWFAGTMTDRLLRRVATLGDGWIPIMGATVDDIRAGASRLRAEVDRPLVVQAPVRVARGATGERDLAATLGGVPELVEAGVNDVYVNLATFAADVDGAHDALQQIVSTFREVTA